MLDELLKLLDDEVAVADLNYRGGQGLDLNIMFKPLEAGEDGDKLSGHLSRSRLERLIKKGLALPKPGVE